MQKLTSLFLAMVVCHHFALGQNTRPATVAERGFRNNPNQVHIKDFVRLPYAEIELELNRASDYDRLRPLDSILALFEKDIAFYQDSLDAVQPGNVRIDYGVDTPGTSRQVRFKSYPTDGDLYVIRNGENARLKIKKDTIKIWIAVPWKTTIKARNGYEKDLAIAAGSTNGIFSADFTYYITVTLYLNSYADIRKLRLDKVLLNNTLDTLYAKLSSSDKKYATSTYSASYEPKTGKYFSTGTVVPTATDVLHDNDHITLYVSGGLGTLRGTLAPMSEVILSLSRDKRYQTYTITYSHSLVFQPFFVFDKDGVGTQHVYNNWFVNYEMTESSSSANKKFPDLLMGAGWLVKQEGGFFKNNTFKIFIGAIDKQRSLVFCPEIIFTNNLQQIFPAFHVKLRL